MADLRSISYNGVTFTVPTGGSTATSLAQLSDVSLSTSPPAGALLSFDGTDWSDADGVLDTLLTGLDKTSGGAITASDTVLSALGKIQYELTALKDKLAEYSDTLLSATDGTTVVEKLVLGKNVPTP